MTPSIKDVAARARVSVGTVSNVLNAPEKVSPDTAERVLRAIGELGFVRNDAARQLKAGVSRCIGFVVLDAANPFFADLARAVEDRAADAGLVVLVASSADRAARESNALDLFEEQRVRGVLISPVGDVTDRLDRLRQRGIAAVLVDRRAANAAFSSVSVDDVEGGRAAARHLLEQGRRDILFVGGPAGLQQIEDRRRGAMEVVGAEPGAVLRSLETAASTVRAGVEAGEAILAMDPPPDAIFAINDLIALGVVQAVERSGRMRIPLDLAVVGYDDIELARASAVPLTSIRQPRERMGVLAVELLLKEIDGDALRQQAVLSPELVVRESSRSRF